MQSNAIRLHSKTWFYGFSLHTNALRSSMHAMHVCICTVLCALRCVMQCIRLFYWMNRAIQCALVDASMRLNNNKNQLDLIDLVWIRKHCSKRPDSNSVTISIYLYTHKYTPFYTQIRAHRFDVALNFIASIYDGNLP